jgi:hypothetical protein
MGNSASYLAMHNSNELNNIDKSLRYEKLNYEKKKLDAIKNENVKLNNKVKELESAIELIKKNSIPINNNSVKQVENKLKNSIEKLVSEMLKNENVNSSYIPDYVEKKIYTNVFTLLIGMMKEVLEDTSINILNQKISFTMASLDNV